MSTLTISELTKDCNTDNVEDVFHNGDRSNNTTDTRAVRTNILTAPGKTSSEEDDKMFS